MKYPYDITQKEYIRLSKNLDRVPKGTPYRCNSASRSELAEIMETEAEFKQRSYKAITSLEHLFEPKEAYV